MTVLTPPVPKPKDYTSTIIEASLGGGVGLLLLLAVLWYRYLGLDGNEWRRRKELATLRIHSAILKKRSEGEVLKLIEQDPKGHQSQSNKETLSEGSNPAVYSSKVMSSSKMSSTLHSKDFDGRTLVDICLKVSRASDNVMLAILRRSLPFQVPRLGDGSDGAMEVAEVAAEDHAYAWQKVVQSDVYVAVVSQILTENPALADSLAYAKDEEDRQVLNIASYMCKAAIRAAVNMFKFYEFRHKNKDGSHRSLTCIVFMADNHETDPPGKVALKFMNDGNAFLREIETRRQGNFDPTHVLGIRTSFDGGSDDARPEIRAEFEKMGLSGFPFCIVMDAGDRNLREIIDQEQFVYAGDAKFHGPIKLFAENLIMSLAHLHDKGFIHGGTQMSCTDNLLITSLQ